MTDSEQGFAILRASYSRSFTSKLAALSEAWRLFAGAGGDETSARALHVLVHRLAGSAGSYGFAELGLLARTVDAELCAWKEMSPDLRTTDASEVARRVAAPMRALLDDLARHAASAESSR